MRFAAVVLDPHVLNRVRTVELVGQDDRRDFPPLVDNRIVCTPAIVEFGEPFGKVELCVCGGERRFQSDGAESFELEVVVPGVEI